MYKKEGDALEEMRKKYDRGMVKFRTLLVAISEISIVILGGRWWPEAAKQGDDKTSEMFLCYAKRVMIDECWSCPYYALERCSITNGMRGHWSNS